MKIEKEKRYRIVSVEDAEAFWIQANKQFGGSKGIRDNLFDIKQVVESSLSRSDFISFRYTEEYEGKEVLYSTIVRRETPTYKRSNCLVRKNK